MIPRHPLAELAERTPLPDPVPFTSDHELREWLGFSGDEPGIEKVTRASFSPTKLQTFEKMRAVAAEINAGRIPTGILVRRARAAMAGGGDE